MIQKAVNFSSARVNHDNVHVIATDFQGKVMYLYGKRQEDCFVMGILELKHCFT